MAAGLKHGRLVYAPIAGLAYLLKLAKLLVCSFHTSVGLCLLNAVLATSDKWILLIEVARGAQIAEKDRFCSCVKFRVKKSWNHIFIRIITEIQ